MSNKVVLSYALALLLVSATSGGTDGGTVIIGTDGSWRSASTDLVTDPGSCPANLGSLGTTWTQLEFNDSAWRQAVPYPSIGGPPPGGVFVWDWPYSGSPTGTNGPVQAFFRRSVVLDSVPTTAIAQFASDDEDQFYVNGILINQDLDGGASLSASLDIKPYLHAGENVFAFRAWDGDHCNFYDRGYEKLAAVITITTAQEPPNTPPVVNAGENLTMTSQDYCRVVSIIQGMASDAEHDPLSYRWLEGQTEVLTWNPVSPSGEATLNLCSVSLNLGQHTLMLEVSDSKVTARDDMLLTINNSAPTVGPFGGGVYEIQFRGCNNRKTRYHFRAIVVYSNK